MNSSAIEGSSRFDDRRVASVTSLFELLSDVGDAVVAFDSSGRCCYANLALMSLVGEDAASDDAGAPGWLAPGSVDAWTRLVNDCWLSGAPSDAPAHVDLLTATGDRVSVNVGCHALRDELDRPIALLAVMHLEHRDPLGEDLGTMLRSVAAALVKVAPLWEPATTRPDVPVPRQGPARLNEISIVGVLSARELEIVTHLTAGQRTATIAEELFISEHTVRNHRKRIYRKLGVSSLGELRKLCSSAAD